MKREDAMQMSDDALKELAESLKQGHSEQLVQYLTTMSRFHRYSFGNCMMIAMQKPEATHVAGFRCWKQLRRSVKKGEKGIAIFAPLVRRKKADSPPAEDPDDDRDVLGFRVVHVFDISQTEGEELPELADRTGDPGDRLSHLEDVVRRKGIELLYDEIPSGALGTSAGGKITVLPDLSPAESFAVLAHELGHELLHRGDRRSETTKTIRELEAEAVAYVVCRSAGLECSTHSSDYIQLYSGDEKLLLQSLELIRDVAAGIIAELETLVSEEVAHVA